MKTICWKDKFETLKKARIAARVRGKKLKKVFQAYHCPICGKYHLTKMKRKEFLNTKEGKKSK